MTEGGHNIPEAVIIRRYTRGIQNLFKLFFTKVDYLAIFDNSKTSPELIAEKKIEIKIFHREKFELLNLQSV